MDKLFQQPPGQCPPWDEPEENIIRFPEEEEYCVKSLVRWKRDKALAEGTDKGFYWEPRDKDGLLHVATCHPTTRIDRRFFETMLSQAELAALVVELRLELEGYHRELESK